MPTTSRALIASMTNAPDATTAAGTYASNWYTDRKKPHMTFNNFRDCIPKLKEGKGHEGEISQYQSGWSSIRGLSSIPTDSPAFSGPGATLKIVRGKRGA